MPNVYSTSFVQLEGLNGTHGVAVPPGYRGVIRDLDVYYSGTFGGTVRLVGENGQTITFHSFPPLDEGDHFQWTGRQVINEGRVFSIVTTDNMDVTCSGYLLSLP